MENNDNGLNTDQKNKNITRRNALKIIGYCVVGGAVAGYGINKIVKNFRKEAAEGGLKMALREDKGASTEISLLGFGCMRFPVIEQKGEDGKAVKIIDMEKSQELVDYAYSHGVNYYDTAYNYHRGKSGEAIGKMLKKYPRESFYLANKMPSWLIEKPEDCKKLFEEQLANCGVDYFDYYLLHALSDRATYDKAYEECGGYNYLQSEKAAGRIKRVGFSFHGDKELFDYLMQKHQWDFVQLQINYVDWTEQNAQYCYSELVKREIPCVVMEPLKGGMLASLSKDAEKILKEAEPDNSIASWAFRYAGSLPGVITVLSGMTEMEHLVDNVKTFSNFRPLDVKERALLDKVIDDFKKYPQIGCTGCSYCMPCKYGVDIPAVFAAYNKCVKESSIPDLNAPRDSKFDSKKRTFLATYKNMVKEGSRADRCIECGRCAGMCPQELPIPEIISKINNLVTELEK
jgi:uncharacterized protein